LPPLIAESTRRLLGDAFELDPLGPRALKGFDAPVPALAVLREAENVSRFEASRSQRLTPFVGREHEVALLLDRWREASEGEGQVALISGEAGIGKSRVLTALSERIGDEPHVRVRYQCSPHHVNDAFYPITSQIWDTARFAQKLGLDRHEFNRRQVLVLKVCPLDAGYANCYEEVYKTGKKPESLKPSQYGVPVNN
jgi:hypothetical protein